MANINRNQILPVNLTFREWGERLRLAFPDAIVPIPPAENKWWGWAESLLLDPTFSAAPIPSKKIYKKSSDWQTWAFYFVYNLT